MTRGVAAWCAAAVVWCVMAMAPARASAPTDLRHTRALEANTVALKANTAALKRCR